jgi:Rrf2 family protein
MISQTAEYALRAAAFLGEREGAARKADEIAESTRVPASYLHKVLAALCRARLVKSRRGPRGGFMLTRPIDDISALDVILAVEPWNRMDTCPLGKPEHEQRLCPLHERLARVQAQAEDSFRRSTLRDLIDVPDAPQ